MAIGKQLSDGNPDGTALGQNAADPIGFYGVTPVTQRAAAIMTATSSIMALTGASFVANTSTTLSGFIVLNTTLAAQLIDVVQEVRGWAVALGLHKGGA